MRETESEGESYQKVILNFSKILSAMEQKNQVADYLISCLTSSVVNDGNTNNIISSSGFTCMSYYTTLMVVFH